MTEGLRRTLPMSRNMGTMKRSKEMRFSRRMLLVITPVGVAIGLYEAWHLAGWLVFLMTFQMLVLLGALVAVVRIVRRESGRGTSRDQGPVE